MNREQLEQMLAKASKSVQKLNEHLARVCPRPEEQYIREQSEPKKKRIRQDTKPLLNKLETEFKYWYERDTGYKVMSQAIRFRLANGIWYKPDFTHLNDFGNMTCIEVKGPHAFRGGFENLKVAATIYPQFTWRLWWRDDDGWHHQKVID